METVHIGLVTYDVGMVINGGRGPEMFLKSLQN